VNSPGGSAAASHEIYEEVIRVTAEKPVVVSMGDICASGGYYISSPAAYVFANPSTLTGSIGVIWDTFEISGLLEMYGVRSNTLKAGEFKDIGSITRGMKENERAMLQSMLDQVHEQFISAVATGREMEAEDVRKLATGMIYTGEKAVELKLVDELGGLEAAKAKARELAGLPEDAKVVTYEQKRSVFDVFDMLSAESGDFRSLLRGLDQPSALEVLARRLLLHDVGRLE
jgi:protease-4